MRTKTEIETAFAPRESLSGRTSFFLVGIGGAGMSGIARMLAHRGFRVRGSDSTMSPGTQALEREGIEVRIGHTSESIEADDALVLTDAIDLNQSPEVATAKKLGAPLYRRSQVLGWLLEGKKTIAVTGTHGKTTTTGMVGAGLRAAGLDPTIVVGAEVKEFGGAILEGESEWAVIEACEAYDSLRDFDPFVVVLTNLELDHIDFHGTWPSLKESVLDFVCKVPPDGAFIYCSDDDGVFEFLGDLDGRCPNGKQTLGYGFRNRLAEMSLEEKKRGGPVFAVLDKLIDKSRELCPSEAWVDHLWLAGRHNALNALGALLACEEAGADREKAIAGILSYRGAERRLEILSEGEVTVIDDYAHHPTEIKASLEAVRSRWMSPGSSGKRLIVVYQPHLYTRTAPLIAEFAEALSLADEVVLTDIYPAREDPLPGVSSFRIAELVRKPCHYVPQRHLLPRKVAKMVRPGDVVVGMGAGNISEFAPALLDELGRLSRRPQGPSVATTSEILIPTQVGSLASLGVTVLYGGDSAEREVSILSSMSVGAALRRRGHEVTLFDVSEALLTTGDLSCLTGMDRPDAVFLEVHGTNAEDGSIQGLLELLHIPYTGSGVQASAIAMDKHLTKSVLESAGLPVPKGVLLKSLEEFDGHAIDLIVSGTLSNGGWVVKPNAQGSTVGLTFVTEHEGLRPAVEKAFQYGDTVLIEEWLQGVEISVPVMSGQAFPVVEILPNKGQYDFANKYTPGATDEICPARLNPGQTKLAQSQALAAHKALGCRGCTRTDMIVLPEKIVCLEVNTLPGMTATSLVPKAAEAAGVSFEDLCEWMVLDALATSQV